MPDWEVSEEDFICDYNNQITWRVCQYVDLWVPSY
jgi:hypothetical protein